MDGWMDRLIASLCMEKEGGFSTHPSSTPFKLSKPTDNAD